MQALKLEDIDNTLSLCLIKYSCTLALYYTALLHNEAIQILATRKKRSENVFFVFVYHRNTP